VKRTIPFGWLIAGLLATSAVLYAVDFAAYPGQRGSIGFYTLLDIAFIPLNVLIVSLVINRLLAARERQALLHKMNMVIGAFFSQMGSDLIGRLSEFDSDVDEDRQHMLFSASWSHEDFERHRSEVCGDHHHMDLYTGDAGGLRTALEAQRPFIVGLLQNGNLLEHAAFTDMLWAVSHLSEELTARGDLSDLPVADRMHVELDMARAYGRLLGEWISYVKHLKSHYPYLFAFVVRSNPFDPDARIEVTTQP
jgi:hypothetical protein